MRASSAVLAICLAGVAAGCNLRPRDPFAAAERALRRDDLLTALQALDSVSVGHPRYPDARAAAVEVEQRMRRCHELMLEALMLRGEWRDEEALRSLRRARELWPKEPSLDSWIAATRRRIELFGGSRPLRPEDGGDPPGPGQSPQLPAVPLIEVDVNASSSVLDEPLGGIAPAPSLVAATAMAEAPSTETPAPEAPPREALDRREGVGEPPVDCAPVGERQAAADDRSAQIATGEDPVALELVTVETLLAGGNLERAVTSLLEVARRYPSDRRVAIRLNRLLHQRALLHYGRGEVGAAIDDWQRLLQLEPANSTVRRYLEQALQECEVVEVPTRTRG